MTVNVLVFLRQPNLHECFMADVKCGFYFY
jgi:hypothetical protein